MIIEFLNFWTSYWILAYGPTVGFLLIAGSGLAAFGTWVKLMSM